MRLFYILCLVLGLTIAGQTVSADQKDPRLNDLFGQLKGAEDTMSARNVERQIWTIWLKTDDETIQDLLNKGIERMHRGDYGTALAAFTHVVEAAPDFAEGWNKRATVYYLMENYQASLDDIVKTLELEPRHFGALSGRGLIYVQLQDLKQALSAFEAALEVHPQSTGPKTNAEAIRKVLGRDI